VQLGLRDDQPGVVLVVLGRGHDPLHQVHRTLVQAAGRLPGGVPLDPPVRGIGGVAADPGRPQRRAAHPGTVVVAVGQEHRTLPDDRVEVVGLRTGGTERRHRPAAPEHPRPVRVRLGTGAFSTARTRPAATNRP
jgi:hypothetical protein